MKEMQDFKKTCRELAAASARVIKDHYRKNISVELKSDQSPVTVADRKAEEVMREMIFKEYPDHGFFGEESGKSNADAEYVWVLDPIDGTKSFLCGVPLFGTLIALLRNGRPILGVINNPILDEYLEGDNNECRLNGEPVRFRECASLEASVLLTTDQKYFPRFRPEAPFRNLVNRVKLYRTWGDCYGYYLLATGFADIMIDPEMSPWDAMALIPVITGAGGVITDYDGGDPVTGSSIVAASKSLHSSVISILNES